MIGHGAFQTSDDWLKGNAATVTDLTNRIWDFAEPGFCETRSAAALCDLLRQHGFSVEPGVAGLPTAFVATSGSSRPRIGVMCEYDATPGESQRPSPFPDADPDRRAGFTDLHNGIGVASAAAAIAVRTAIEAHGLAGSVIVFGTPAEKLCIGKPFMAREGLFDGLDAIIAWHPRAYSTVEWDDGPGCYQAEIFDFFGESAYGGAPSSGVNALDAMIQMMATVKVFRGNLPAQITINEMISRGGDHPTAIPNHAQIWYVYRAPTRAGIERARDGLSRAARGAVAAFGASFKSRVVAATRPWLPNHALAEICYRNLERVGPPHFPEPAHVFAREVLDRLERDTIEPVLDETLTDPKSGATSDFAGGADDVTEFCWHAPTARIYIAYGLAARGVPNWARSAFTRTEVAHTTVMAAARTVAFSVLDLLCVPDGLEAAAREYRRRLGDVGPLAPLLPPDLKPPMRLDSAPPYVTEHLLRQYTAGGEAP